MRVNTRYKDVPLVEFMYLVFTRMPGESYRRLLRSFLLYSCYICVCWGGNTKTIYIWRFEKLVKKERRKKRISNNKKATKKAGQLGKPLDTLRLCMKRDSTITTTKYCKY